MSASRCIRDASLYRVGLQPFCPDLHLYVFLTRVHPEMCTTSESRRS